MCEFAAEGKVEHIRLLATNGVDVSLGDYDDRTPLHLVLLCVAVCCSVLQCVANGVDVSLEDYDDHAPFHLVLLHVAVYCISVICICVCVCVFVCERDGGVVVD